MISPTIVSVCLLTFATHVVAAQERSDAMEVEIVAARAMLATRVTTGTIGLDPRPGRSGAAPSFAASGANARAHATILAKALGSSLKTYEEASDCTGDCQLVGVTAHLTLSAPTFSGDTATITVTLVENSLDGKMGPLDYETVQFILSRGAHGWVIIKRLQLGVS